MNMGRKKWTQFTKEQLQEMASASTSSSQWIMKMGYQAQGGNITRVPKEILELYPDIDVSHFTGQAWNKGKDSYELLEHNYQGKRDTIKRALINHRGHKCEKCGLTTWNGQEIPLEVHHLNGNNKDNDPSNLQLVCPNCHALTDFYRGKNIDTQGSQKIEDKDFIQALRSYPNIRQALLSLGLSAKGANYEKAYRLIEENNIEHLRNR